MTNGRGDNTKILSRIQAAFGAAEGAEEGGFYDLPFYDYGVTPDEDLGKDDAISGDHFSGDIVSGLQNLKGSMVVPIGLNSIGWHLKVLFGDPSTTGGATNYVHTFRPAAQPVAQFMTHCKSHKDIATHFVQDSLVYTGFDLSGKKDNQRARISFDLIGRQEQKAGASLDTTPVAFAEDLVPVGFTGKVLLNNAEAASIQSFSGKVATNAETDQETMNGLATSAGVDLGTWEGNGSIGTRFRDTSFYDLATAGTLVDLALEYRINANRYAKFTFKNVRLERTGAPVSGREVMSVDFNFMVGRPAPGEVPFEVEIGNGVASYANPA